MYFSFLMHLQGSTNEVSRTIHSVIFIACINIYKILNLHISGRNVYISSKKNNKIESK